MNIKEYKKQIKIMKTQDNRYCGIYCNNLDYSLTRVTDIYNSKQQLIKDINNNLIDFTLIIK